ncbi:MAG: GNAT family N-acetyltransferase, partial [Aeromicrobium sp.]
MQVREARENEWDAVGELPVAGYDANGYLTDPDGTFDDVYAGWLRDAASRGRNSVLLIAVDGDEPLGTVSWCPPGSPDRQVSTSDTQGEFRTLSVAADARGRGVGRALVTECFDRARSAGMTEMVLCSLPEMTPAHKL